MNDVQAANYIMQRMRQDDIMRVTVRRICEAKGYRDLVDWANKEPGSLIQFAEGEKELEPVYENPDLNHVDLDPLTEL
jgi:hypothetical protein